MGQNKHSRPGVRHTPPARLPSDTIFLGVHASNLFNLIVSLTQPSRGRRGGGLPIVGFLNCGPTCKANSNTRPQTVLRFARTPRNMVSDGSRAGGVCRTPGRECLLWPMPPYYSYYIVVVSRIRGAGYVQRTH